MPRDTLTREQIVAAAVELLDDEGLEGLNMHALGVRPGSAATAVYWHVGSKEDLVALAADAVWHEVALIDPAAVGWREAAVGTATSLYAMLCRHTWLVQVFGSYLAFGPGKARHDDHALAVYEAAGFVGTHADQAAAAVFTFVLGNGLAPAAASLTRRLDRDGRGPQRLREGMARAQEVAATFPRLRARLGTASAEYAAAPDDTFTVGLHALLDGLDARLRTI